MTARAEECREACLVGTCTKTWSDPYGCGGCCECLGGCWVTYENSEVGREERAEDERSTREMEMGL